MSRQLRIQTRYLNETKGTTAVEFALVSIAFLMLIFGIFESGRMFWMYNTLQYAAEIGARYTLTDPDATDGEITNKVYENLNGIASNDPNLNISIGKPTAAGGNVQMVTIDITYNFQTILPFLPSGWNSFQLTARSQLPIPES